MEGALYCRVPTDWLADPSQCWFEWQTLAGAMLALLAAGITACLLHRQIIQADIHERKTLERQHNAIRATLPLTLAGLCQCLRQMLLALDAAKIEYAERRVAIGFEPPSAPVQHIQQLQDVIASTDKRSIITLLSHIIREIQTLWARTEILADRQKQERRVGLERNIDEWIIQAAQIYALIESLFEYARSEVEEGPYEVSWKRAEAAIFRFDLNDENLGQIIEKGLDKSANFWVSQ